MCPPAVAPLVDTDECDPNEELFMFMLCAAHGYVVPAYVITDVNPFNCLPETLSENMWYFTNAMEKKGAEGGFWKPRGEPREIFGDDSIIGWEATHEFYEGEGLHDKKTNWSMVEYYITPKVSREAVVAKDANSLCKVFHSRSSPISNWEMPQNVAGTESCGENFIYSPPPDYFNIPTEQCVTNQMQVDTISCNISEGASSTLPSQPVENWLELDHFVHEDYFELLDLLTAESPSSSWDNSSCMTTLSHECFDYLDAMLDLEAESGDHVEHKDAASNLSVSDSSKPEDIVDQAAISALPVEEISSSEARDGRAVHRDGSPPLNVDSQSSGLLNTSRTPSADERDKTDGPLKKLKRKYLPASSSQSSDGSSSVRSPSPGPGGITKTDGTLKKLKNKYLCFMPF